MSKFKLFIFFILLLTFSGCTWMPIEIIFNMPVPVNNTDLTKSDGSLVILEEAHYRNHLGDVYTLSSNFTLGVGASTSFMGCTDSAEIHFINFDIIVTNAPVEVNFYEAPTITNNGTLLTPLNMNRNFPDNSTMLLYGNPTITANGLKLFVNGILGSKNQIQSNFGQTVEWILNSETCYLFEIINNDGNNNKMVANLIYYQE